MLGAPSTSMDRVSAAEAVPFKVSTALMVLAPFGSGAEQAQSVFESVPMAQSGVPPAMSGPTTILLPAYFVPLISTIVIGEKAGTLRAKAPVPLEAPAPLDGAGLGAIADGVPVALGFAANAGVAIPTNTMAHSMHADKKTRPLTSRGGTLAPRSRNERRIPFEGEGCTVSQFSRLIHPVSSVCGSCWIPKRHNRAIDVGADHRHDRGMLLEPR